MGTFNSPLDQDVYEATVLELFKLNNIDTYVPFDPYTLKMPSTPQNFKSRKITGNYYIVYSPNVQKLSQQLNKLLLLFVNYTMPLSYQYYGEEKPPERSLEDQYNDWKNGYQLSRMKLPNDTITEQYLEKIEQILGQKIPRGWYWVKHHARLIELPPEILSLQRGVITLTYKIPTPLLTTPFISNIYEYFSHYKEGLVQNVENFIKTLGFTVDTDLQYQINGKTVKGIQIVASKDNTYYIVYVPVKKEITEQVAVVVYAVAAVIVALIAYFAVKTYMVESVNIAKIEYDKEKLEVDYKKIALNFLSENPTLANEVAQNPQLAKDILTLSTTLQNNNTSSNSLSSEFQTYAKYALYGIGALFGGIILLNLLQYMPKPQRR